VGPGQDAAWSPILVGDDDPWVDRYRGLWGLDTGDRLAGERAPAGPKYTRTGTVRQSWNDPLGFVGLAAVPTPANVRRMLEDRVEALRAERSAAESEAETLAAALPAIEVEVEALSEVSGVEAYRGRRVAELREGEARLAALRASTAELRAAVAASEDWLERPDEGWRGDPRAHLTHAAEPEAPGVAHGRGFAEGWAALSVGTLLVALALILWFHLLPVPLTLVVLVIGYLAIESFAQRRVEILLLRVTIALAAVAAGLLAWTYLRELVLAGLFALGVFILFDNLRELVRR
jgi:hypothetical protein